MLMGDEVFESMIIQDDEEDEIEEEEAKPKKPIKHIKCPKCKGKVPIYTKKRPVKIECPECGKKGTLKK